MTAQQELGSLNPDAIIELFEMHATIDNRLQIIRWSNQENIGNSPVSINGQEFQPWPIQASGFKKEAQGTLPQPTIVVSNYRSVLTAILEQNRPYNAKIVRRRIFAKHLDSGSSPNPNAEFSPEEFYLDAWDINALEVSLKLVTPIERLNNQIPKRRLSSL